jgi:tetratricopeptide (TPR) repeat protein
LVGLSRDVHEPRVRGRSSRGKYAEKSLALDSDLAEGYAARGLLRLNTGYDWQGSRADFARALKLNPNDAEAHGGYARLLAMLGGLPEAVEEARKSTEIDPLSARSWTLLGLFHYSSGQLDAGRTALQKSLQIAPEQGYAMLHLAIIHLLEKKPAEALEMAERNRFEPFKLLCKAMALHDLGRTAEVERVLEQLVTRYGHDAAWQIACAYAWVGQPDKAFEWLDRAYAQRDGGLKGIKYFPLLRGLRGDPRFAAMLAKMNLPPD